MPFPFKDDIISYMSSIWDLILHEEFVEQTIWPFFNGVFQSRTPRFINYEFDKYYMNRRRRIYHFSLIDRPKTVRDNAKKAKAKNYKKTATPKKAKVEKIPIVEETEDDKKGFW